MKPRYLSVVSLLVMSSVVLGQSPVARRSVSRGAANYLLPSTGTITNHGTVKIDGANASSGQTLFSGNTVKTAVESSSTLDLNNSTRLKVGPETEVTLEFSRFTVAGSVAKGRLDALIPAGVCAQMTTGDLSVINDVDQPAAFAVQVDSGVTIVTVKSGRIELHSSNHVQSLMAGESFATGIPAPIPDVQNLNKKERVGIIAGIGAAVAILLVAMSGDKETMDEQFGGCIDLLSGDSNCR